MTVVVITDRYDPTADLVVSELNRRAVPVFRFDTAEFPQHLTVTADLAGSVWAGEINTHRRNLDLEAITGMYYRRPTAFAIDPEQSAEERRWSGVQARLGFGGLLAATERWLNHPHRIGYAEYKPVQLGVAQDAGLRVPRTCVTNDPAAARRFVTDVGRAICKPFGANGIVDDGGSKQVFATIVAPTDCDDSVRYTMHLFQEWVPKNHEVRLTVVDNRFFAARIDARSDAAHVDWRCDYANLDYRETAVPPPVREAVSELLRRFGLRFGALDFVVDEQDQWWFLECNPNGQWGWIEDETGLPIADALATALEGSQRA